MLISSELNEAINAQIGREYGASMQYLSIATYYDQQALPRLAKFFYEQSAEEREHALKFVHYIVETGGQLRIPPVEAPLATFESAEHTFRLSLEWEQEVTRQINHLMDIAVEQKDYLARHFLDWFINEQLEEINTMDNLLRIVQRAGERNLIMLESYFSHLD